ncbi:MAG TPA: amino acid permease [Thermodesulfobacteriota bacterium]|nr:amino acid permease [Thermodesulfobacteriota bacterium]
MVKRLFRRKFIHHILEEIDIEEHRLHRALNAFDLTILGIGAIVGVGIFVLTGNAAAVHAGPGVVLSFVISGLACAFAALCYAEFAALIPVAGSAYNYAYATLGELVAWIIGWDLILEYIVASIAVAIGWSGYFVNILKAIGITLPVWCAAAPGTVPGAIINLPAMFIVLLLTTILVIGIKESARLTSAMVFVKLITVLVFILVGFSKVNPSHWVPFMPFGFKGVLSGAAIVFFAYIGFDAVSTAAEETKNPQKNIPIGIIASLAICTILYIVVAAVLTGMVSYKDLNHPAPVAHALNVIGFQWGSALVSAGAVAGITSVLLVMLMGQPRVFFSMSRDGLLWPWIYKVHPRFRTPYIAQIITGVVVAGFAGFIDIGTAAELCNIGTLFAFAIVCGGIAVLRYTHPEIKRPFRCPLVPLIPLLGICFCVGLMLALPKITWIRFVIWLIVGLFIYFFYGIRHSRLGKKLQGNQR